MAHTTTREEPLNENPEVTKQVFQNAMACIAQGAINIDSGMTTIEKCSRIHNAMHSLCELVNTGKVGLLK